MGNKLRHEGDEVRIKVIWPDVIRRIQWMKLVILVYLGAVPLKQPVGVWFIEVHWFIFLLVLSRE